MTSVTHLATRVQVMSVRCAGYAMVVPINRDGSLTRRKGTLTVRFPRDTHRLVVEGSVWDVAGPERCTSFAVRGYIRYETLIDAQRVTYVRPSGLILARWIAANVPGIGSVIANRLVRQRKLDHWVANNDLDALTSKAAISEKQARNLVAHWPAKGLYDAIEWLQERNLPAGLADPLIGLWKDRTVETLEKNPFLLLAVGVSYADVLKLSDGLGIARHDPRVISGTALHEVVRHSANTGSTVLPPKLLKTKVERRLGLLHDIDPGRMAIEHGLLAGTPDGYQVLGAALMEAQVAKFLVEARRRRPGEGSVLAAWEHEINPERAMSALRRYEKSLSFTLTQEQAQAVVGAVCTPVAGISGGAGTGKTTILRAVLGVYRLLSRGLPVYPVALAGRAAQRMAESIGSQAQTIAKLTHDHLGDGRPSLPDHVFVVIDEASMVDLLSFHRLVGLLPRASRLLFVGDIAQLPPIGSGLVFHALQEAGIPFFELSQVLRQAKDSRIVTFASAARESRCTMPEDIGPTLSASKDCSFLETPSLNLLTKYWSEAGAIETKIILTPVRGGNWGVNSLNRHFQAAMGADRPAVHYPDADRGHWLPWITESGTELREGDSVMVTRNLYSAATAVRNGDLGVITQAYDAPGPDDTSGVVTINGSAMPLTLELLSHLELGYAVTIHKAQGSQWSTVFVVIPDYADHMLDATLIYTAATRPTHCLVLVGDPRVLRQAISRGNAATRRLVGLKHRIRCAGTQMDSRTARNDATSDANP